MGSNGASGASSYRQRADADILGIADHAERAGLHIAKPATDMPLRPEHDQPKDSSAQDDLPDHIRRFCQRFFSSDNGLF
jgi:hypothetical protein